MARRPSLRPAVRLVCLGVRRGRPCHHRNNLLPAHHQQPQPAWVSVAYPQDARARSKVTMAHRGNRQAHLDAGDRGLLYGGQAKSHPHACTVACGGANASIR